MEYRKIRTGRDMTVGQWAERTIAELREPSRGRPSSNWQVYVTLLHKLQAEGSVILTPLRSVGDNSFRRLIRWMGTRPNFSGTMRTFAALLRRAYRRRLTRYRADFPYRDFAPSDAASPVSAEALLSRGGTVRSLTSAQWQQFLSMDLSRIPLRTGPSAPYWKELYRDYCILLYELRSRPVDILQLHSSSLAFHPDVGRTLCSYIPAKKKNRPSPAIQYLTPGAEAVVARYRGRSRGGYVLPFPLNDRRWNLTSPSQYRDHYRLAVLQLAKVNRFLHLVGEALSLPFPLTIYVIRRSAITHALVENRIPLAILAKMAGTSVRMIERHYTNYLHTLAAY